MSVDTGLIPNDIRNRVIKDKADMLRLVERLKLCDLKDIPSKLNEELQGVGIVKLQDKSEDVDSYTIDYDIITCKILVNQVKNTINISSKADVYFQTMDIINVKKYKNKMGKYHVQYIDGVTYWVECKEYDWSRFKLK